MTTRPRAADDFAAIRARMEELRRARAQVVNGEKDGTPRGPRLNYQVGHEGRRILPRSTVRRVLG